MVLVRVTFAAGLADDPKIARIYESNKFFTLFCQQCIRAFRIVTAALTVNTAPFLRKLWLHVCGLRRRRCRITTMTACTRHALSIFTIDQFVIYIARRGVLVHRLDVVVALDTTL